MQDRPKIEAGDSFWALDAREAARRLSVDPAVGLTAEEAARRLEQFGPNQIREEATRGLAGIFFSQFAELMIVLLAVAAVISAVIGEWADSALIGIIVLANAVVGAAQEWRAERAVAALKELSRPTARVVRAGGMIEARAVTLVPGDIIELRGGDFVPADCRLMESFDLQVDEAPLTGESLPVDKSIAPVAKETSLPDRHSMVYAGTAVAQGRARALVTGTGMGTELGNIARLLQTAEKTQTPLQQRLAALSKRLAIIVVALSFVILVAGIVREKPQDWNRKLVGDMLLVAVSLAVAAIPEGLPAVITVALALGSQRAARRNAIVRKLAAVETLGSVDVICTDKTGTLTQNRMEVAEVIPFSNDGDAAIRLLEAGSLCNDAKSSPAGGFVGSATEMAIINAAVRHGIDPESLRARWPRLAEIPFKSARKRMATLHRAPDGARRLFVKGAVEAILQRSTRAKGDSSIEAELDHRTREIWIRRADELAERGRRVLAVAMREWDGDALSESDDAETSLVLIGMIAIVDPVRPEVAPAIAKCRSAGVRPVMITGDHKGTARAIGDELGLREPDDRVVSGTELDAMDDEVLTREAPGISVYARVSPQHKLRIVQAWKGQGSVVAMTGDGVNDAPALKQSDIGIAMGITGTDVSREAADMVLADDNFSTIVSAVEEGRVVYDNIRKFVRYMLTTNAAEVIVLFLGIILGMPLPLLPIHILWINLVTDGLPALALGFEPAEPDIMRRPPRQRNESIFAGGMGRSILATGLLMGISCVAVYYAYLSGVVPLEIPAGQDAEQYTVVYARTLVFLMVSLAQLIYVLAIRSSQLLYFELPFWSNYRLTVAVLAGAAAQVAIIYVKPLARYFHTVPLSARDLAVGVAVAGLAFGVAEATKLIRRIGERRKRA